MMKPSKIIGLEELGKLLDCPPERVKIWLEEQPEDLLISRGGKRGVDPVKLREMISK